MMNCCFAMMDTQSSHCTMSAAAASSARVAILMDTVLLAVSILFVSIIRLLGM